MKKKIKKQSMITVIAIVMLILPITASIGWTQPIGQALDNIEFGKEAAVYMDGKKVGIGEAIKLAIQSNSDIISGAYDLAMLDSAYKMYQKKYSPFLSAQGSGSYQEYPESTSLLTGTDSKTWSAAVGIAKNFPTGTQLVLGVAQDKTSTSYLPLAFTLPGIGTISMPAFGDPDYYRTQTFISLKQDLLQNGFGYNEQREQRQMANAAFMQKDYILYQLSLVVLKVVMDYWDVVLKESALKNAELQYSETKMVRDITQHNVELGMTNSFELNYYNVMVAAAKAQLTMANQVFSTSKRAFLRSINAEDGAVLEGKAVLINQLPESDEPGALQAAYAKRADYLGAKRKHDQAAWELEIARNLALPTLTAALSLNSMGQQLGVDDAWQDLLGAKQIGYSAELALTYPLGGDPVQKTKERNARYALKKADIELQKYERLIKDEIRETIEQIQTVFDLYQTARQARVEAESFYQAMMGQLERGRLNASMVKNGVDALASSRQQELEALIRFNMMQLQFVVKKNELFESYGIDPDHYIPK